MALTGRQQEIYDFIVRYRRQHGCSPSIPEIQRQFGMRSPNGVAGHLKALEAKGVIYRADRGSRQIELSGPGQTERGPLYDLPLYGHIPAGVPIAASESAASESRADSCVTLDGATLGFQPRPGCYALRVSGNSMSGAGILPGDLVVVDPHMTAKNGHVVAALIDGESTLKRLVRVGDQLYLKAENPDFPDIHPRTSLSVQGVVRSLVRRMT